MCSYYFSTLKLKIGKTKTYYIRFVIGLLEWKKSRYNSIGGLNSAAYLSVVVIVVNYAHFLQFQPNLRNSEIALTKSCSPEPLVQNISMWKYVM